MINVMTNMVEYRRTESRRQPAIGSTQFMTNDIGDSQVMSKTKYTASDVVFVEKSKHANFKDIDGQVFGRLTVIGFAGKRNGDNFWWCKCECGGFKKTVVTNLTKGLTQSCGCLQKERSVEATTTHGLSKSPEYKIYDSAKRRCTYPKDSHYKYYGGKGVKFLFKSFEEFYEHMGPRPTPEHSIERLDAEGDYCPSNTVWADRFQQARNRTNNRNIEIDGVVNCARVWAKRYGTLNCYPNRIRRGWCDKCAVTLPSYSGTCSHKESIQ